MIPLRLLTNKKANPEHSNSSTDSIRFFCILRYCASIALWMLALLVFIPVQGYAQEELDVPQLSIQAQSYLHNLEEGTYLYHNATVEWEEISVESTEILYHPEKNKLTAKGYVRVTESDMIAVMDELEINIKNGNGIFRNAIYYDPSSKTYMTAKEMRRVGKGKYTAKTCTFTTCNPKSPAWEITGSEVNYYSQNFSSSSVATLKVGGVAVFHLPYLAWPTVKRRQSGFLPPEYLIVRSSQRKFDLGYRFGIPHFWAIDQEQDLTLTYDWVERRGPGFRMDYQYAWKEGMRGGIKYQQFFERDARDPENESGSLSAHEIGPSELHPKRFKFQFNHNQQLDDRSRLIVSALSYSDSQFHREYELVENPNLTAQQFSANINRQFTKGSVTLSASQNRLFSELAILNRNIVSEPIYIPVISFQFSDVFLRSGETTLSRGVSGSATQWFTNQGSSGEEVSISPELSLVFPFFRHFNGSLGISETFSRTSSRNPNVPGSKKGEFQIMRGNAQIGTTLSRIFSRESGYYSRIKHLLSTTLHYDYIEDVEGSGQSTRRMTTLRLNNTLLAKRRYFERSLSNQIRSQTREGKSWTLASLNFVQHYDNLKEDPYFQSIGEAIKGNETEPGQPLIPLRTSFGFNPGPGFFVNYFNRYHHQKRQVVEYSATVSVGLSTHNKASVNFRKNKLAYQTPFGIDVDVANTFSFSNSFEASDELAFGFSGTVNIDADTYTFRRRLSSSALTLDYRPDCWNIRLALTENVGTTVSNSGREQEYIDRTLYAYINLGGISIPEQIYPELD